MQSFIDSWCWLPKERWDEFPFSSLRDRLRVTITDFDGSRRIVPAWRESESKVAIPREFGRRFLIQCTRESFQDHSVYPNFPWPSLSPEFSYREGQEEAVSACYRYLLKEYGGYLKAPTGSGKTICCLAVAGKLNTPALVLVNKDNLSDQWKKSAERIFPGIKIGHVQQSRFDWMDKHLVTATVQTIHSRWGDYPSEFFTNFGIVIADEFHHSPSNTYLEAITLFPSRYRFGCTATDYRKDGSEELWDWHIGGCAYEITSGNLRGKYCQIHLPIYIRDFQRRGKADHVKIVSAISSNGSFNQWILTQIKKSALSGRNTLVLSDRLHQLRYLQKRLLSEGFTDLGFFADSSNESRSSLLQAKECKTILATYGMCAEGVDIPRLDTLIFATPRSDVTQAIGRIQRFYPNKKEPLVVDPIVDNGYCRILGYKRAKIYKSIGFQRVSPISSNKGGNDNGCQ